jgi:hypothetical protein
MKLFFILFVASYGALASANDLLPLCHGSYSSGNCEDAANAELLFYDGKSLNGAHSAECAMRLVHKQDDRFDVTQTCPAEHVADSVPAYAIGLNETVTVLTFESFALSRDVTHNEQRTFRFCSKQ